MGRNGIYTRRQHRNVLVTSTHCGTAAAAAAAVDQRRMGTRTDTAVVVKGLVPVAKISHDRKVAPDCVGGAGSGGKNYVGFMVRARYRREATHALQRHNSSASSHVSLTKIKHNGKKPGQSQSQLMSFEHETITQQRLHMTRITLFSFYFLSFHFFFYFLVSLKRCCNHAHWFLKISSYLDCMPQRLSFCCLFLFLFCFLDLQISYFTMFFMAELK